MRTDRQTAIRAVQAVRGKTSTGTSGILAAVDAARAGQVLVSGWKGCGEMKHFLRKLWGTVRILTNLGMARTFGQYVHSVGGYTDFEYARYRWRGREWAVPTTPFINHETDCP